MLEWITKYWLEVLFGLVVTGMGLGMKKIWKMYKDAQIIRHKEEREEISQEIDEKIEIQNERMIEADEKITNEMHNIEDGVGKITKGMLSIQGQTFRAACHRLLESDHSITIDEYEQIVRDHETYNSLGGNHIGDNLFKLVETKFSNQTTQIQE